jgi:large-conductance mechanosensitive channel
MNFNRLNVISQLKQFIMENNTIGTIAGVCIGVSAKDFIHSAVTNVAFPYLKKALSLIPSPLFKTFTHLDKKNAVDFNEFFTNLISFILTLLLTMWFIKLAFHSFLGITKPSTQASASASFNNQKLANTLQGQDGQDDSAA